MLFAQGHLPPTPQMSHLQQKRIQSQGEWTSSAAKPPHKGV